MVFWDPRRAAVITALVVAVVLPHSVAAQSDSTDTPNTDENTPVVVDDAPAPPEVTTELTSTPAVVEPTASDTPMPVPTPQPAATAIPLPFVHALLVSTAPSVVGPNHPEPPSTSVHPPMTHLLPDPTLHFGPTGYDNSQEAMNQIPSPVGAPLFIYIWFPIGTESYHEMRLAEDSFASYNYTCPSGQCTGSAEAVWRAMPEQQRQQYLASLVQAARDNQSWGAKRFGVEVRVGAGGPELGCARLTADDPTITFSDSCF